MKCISFPFHFKCHGQFITVVFRSISLKIRNRRNGFQQLYATIREPPRFAIRLSRPTVFLYSRNLQTRSFINQLAKLIKSDPIQSPDMDGMCHCGTTSGLVSLSLSLAIAWAPLRKMGWSFAEKQLISPDYASCSRHLPLILHAEAVWQVHLHRLRTC